MAARQTKIQKAIEIAGTEIRMAEARIAALHFALQRRREKGLDGDAKAEFSALHAALFADLNEAYRTFFMWSTMDEVAADEARRLAHQRYLGTNSQIMQYLGFESGYSAAEEVVFRNEIAEAKRAVGNRGASRRPRTK